MRDVKDPMDLPAPSPEYKTEQLIPDRPEHHHRHHDPPPAKHVDPKPISNPKAKQHIDVTEKQVYAGRKPGGRLHSPPPPPERHHGVDREDREEPEEPVEPEEGSKLEEELLRKVMEESKKDADPGEERMAWSKMTGIDMNDTLNNPEVQRAIVESLRHGGK